MNYLIGLSGLAAGLAAGYWLRRQIAINKAIGAENKAEKIIDEAKTKEKEILLKAQDKALKLIDEAKQENESHRKEITGWQARLEKRETAFSQKIMELQDKQQQLYDKITQVEETKEKINQIKQEQTAKLEEIAKLNTDQAKDLLLEKVEQEASDSLISRLDKLNEEASDQIEEKSRELMAAAMQRLASTFTAEITTTVVDLPNDEMKGRIIGREGRNIKTIEQLTGVEIIVDDTPNAITVSGFSGIRRQIAKRALDHLIKDGRIHPTKIEDAIEKAKQDLAIDIKKAGEDALYELGVTGFETKLVQIIGRLKYRTSYGQNALRHSVEVAHLSGLLAEELGADTALAKKSGLLHDIGKAVDHEVKGTHPQIGGNIARKFNLPQEIIDPIETHHDDHPRSLIAVIVKVADAISSSRPGARNDSLDQYIQRLEELEKIANSFAGVDKTYAIQAGREVRVFVKPEEITDLSAHELAVKMAKQIEQDLKYPGEIKISVIRELRVIEYAR
jgi:ribonuclease Y